MPSPVQPHSLSSQRSDWRVQLLPANGACAIAIEARQGDQWCPVAHPPSAEQIAQDTRLRFGNYVLLPYSNRIGHGQLRASAGGTQQLPANLADHPHPLHGVGWLQAWQRQPAHAKELRLRLRWPGGPAWPWAFDAEQRWRLLGRRTLQMDVVLTARGPGAMPAGVGWHPYLMAEGAELRLRARRMQTMGTDKLPDGWAPAPAALREGRRTALIDLPELDTSFGGWRGQAQVRWPARSLCLQIEARGALRQRCVIYRPGDQPFFCLEPVSHANNALGQPLHTAAAWGQRWLQPGQSLRGSLRWRLG